MTKLLAVILLVLCSSPVLASDFDDWLISVFNRPGAHVTPTAGTTSRPAEVVTAHLESAEGPAADPEDIDNPSGQFDFADCNVNACGDVSEIVGVAVDGAGKPLCQNLEGCDNPDEVPLSAEALADPDWYPGKVYD